MTDEIIRKWVKPAHEGACIPDPAHKQDLPQAGLEVVWDHYWRGREMKGDIIVSDEPFDAPKASEKTPVPTPPVPVEPAGKVPLRPDLKAPVSA